MVTPEPDSTYNIYTACPQCGKVDYHSETYYSDCTLMTMHCVVCGCETRYAYRSDQGSWKRMDTYTPRNPMSPFEEVFQ